MLTYRFVRFLPLLLVALLMALSAGGVGAQDNEDAQFNERCRQLGLSLEDCRIYVSLPASFLERCRLQVATPQGCVRLWQTFRNTGNGDDSAARCQALGLSQEECRIFFSLPQDVAQRCKTAGLSAVECVRRWTSGGNADIPPPNNDPNVPVCPEGVQPTPERPCRPNEIPVCPEGVQPTPERPCRPNEIPVCPEGVQPTPERPCRPRPCADSNNNCEPPRPCGNLGQPCPPPNPGTPPNPPNPPTPPNPITPPNPGNVPPPPPGGNTPPRPGGNA